MQIFRLRRGDIEHGMSPISKEFFEVELAQTVLYAATEGLDVVVAIAGKIIKPSNLVLYNDLLKKWRKYYEYNRYRFDFETYILHPAGTRMDMYDDTKGEKFRLATDPDPNKTILDDGYADGGEPYSDAELAAAETEPELRANFLESEYQRREVLFRSWV